MILEHTSYRNFLRSYLTNSTQKNPMFSMRAMARRLGLTGSQLSEVLNGKANFSFSRALRIARQLDLDDQEAEYFCWLVQMESESDPVGREMLTRQVELIRKRLRTGDETKSQS
jgi:uncharacterized protein (TIGR02147 family)